MRQLQTNAPACNVITLLQDQQDTLDASLQGALNWYRYMLPAVAIPDYSRACHTVVRIETLRRLTIIAIALKRHQLRTGHYPSTLEVLVPDYLSSGQIDPMSGQPFHYRTNANGSFTLYSVGENGVDDGGDASPVAATNQFDFWSGRDVVWPRGCTTYPSAD